VGERSRRRKQAVGTACYLCGRLIVDTESWNFDHVPPRRFVAKVFRQRFNPKLTTLATHTACNSAYQRDEEYFVAALSGALPTTTGAPVFAEFMQSVSSGSFRGLANDIFESSVGNVLGADGTRFLYLHPGRLANVGWKLVKGLYFMNTGRYLPDEQPKINYLRGIKDPDPTPHYSYWMDVVAATPSLADSPRFFDYKWIGRRSGDCAVNIIAMMFWEQCFALHIFHDVICQCGLCAAVRNGARVVDFWPKKGNGGPRNLLK
jgi:hypothetical protein